jgi:hypothetical protein
MTSGRSKGSDQNWSKKYKELETYKKENSGNVSVPRNHPSLGEWVHTQRNWMKTSRYKDEKRYALLLKIGLKPYEDREDDRHKKRSDPIFYRNLEEFQKTKNNPSEKTKDSDWVTQIRCKAKKNILPEDHVKALYKAGFGWNSVVKSKDKKHQIDLGHTSKLRIKYGKMSETIIKGLRRLHYKVSKKAANARKKEKEASRKRKRDVDESSKKNGNKKPKAVEATEELQVQRPRRSGRGTKQTIYAADFVSNLPLLLHECHHVVCHRMRRKSKIKEVVVLDDHLEKQDVWGGLMIPTKPGTGLDEVFELLRKIKGFEDIGLANIHKTSGDTTKEAKCQFYGFPCHKDKKSIGNKVVFLGVTGRTHVLMAIPKQDPEANIPDDQDRFDEDMEQWDKKYQNKDKIQAFVKEFEEEAKQKVKGEILVKKFLIEPGKILSFDAARIFHATLTPPVGIDGRVLAIFYRYSDDDIE